MKLVGIFYLNETQTKNELKSILDHILTMEILLIFEIAIFKIF